MSRPELSNRLRAHRQRLNLSQQELADLVGVSRQAIVGIEGGKQVPSTTLGLHLARELRCAVEDLFALSTKPDGLLARLAPGGTLEAKVQRTRVVMGEVQGSWVAHPLPAEGTEAADGIVRTEDAVRPQGLLVAESTAASDSQLRPSGAGGSPGAAEEGMVETLVDPASLQRNVLVSGCAPILGMLGQRVGSRFADSRGKWLPGNSRRSLDLLEAGLIHIAGVHLSGPGEGEDHESLVRGRFPLESMLIVNLTRWREGLVLPAGNPLGVHTVQGLLRPNLRFARREEGAGARRLVDGLLAAAGAEGISLPGLEAHGHEEVAQLVRSGAVDAGVAIESVALAAGLSFVPLTEERFDLVVPASIAESPPVSRFLDALDDPSFRAEMAHVPGYDTSLCGHITTLEAA